MKAIAPRPGIEGSGIQTPAPSTRWVLTALSLSMLMPSLETSIANAALPTFANAFDASFQEVQWIVLSYLLVITTLIVSIGRLGDLISRRRLFLGGVALFTFASLLCSLAPTLWFIIAARAIQGLGAAIMLALAMAFVGETVPKEKTGSAMGLLGTMSAIGTTLGPSLGGVLIAVFHWRTIFLVNVLLGFLNFLILYRSLPADHEKTKADQANLDIMGTFILVLALAAYALAMTMGRGRFGALNIGLLISAVAGASLFIIHELRTSSPLIRLAMFRDPSLSAGLATSTLVSTVMMTTLVVGPFYLSRALGLEAGLVGFTLSAGPLVAALAGVPAGRVVDKFGAWLMAVFGLIGIAGGSFLLSVIPMRVGIVGYILPIVIITSGYALFQAANNTQIMTGVNPERRGVISGMLSLSRNLGLITGASVMGAVFAVSSRVTEITNADPEAVAAGMRMTFTVSGVLSIFALGIALINRKLSQQNSSNS